MAQNNTQATANSVDDFIAGVADPAIEADCRNLATLMSRVTGEPAVMWGDAIVGFGRYAYRYDSGRTGESAIVGFSPRKANLTLYIVPGFAEFEPLLARLGKHSVGKSCLYVKSLADINMAVLEELLRRSVEAMRLRYPVT